ncbi:MAG: restriction endonuclease [Rhizobiaceae bacterium]|nr:restriction endonuclease [Rhizobiaceae bacterium]
MRGSVVVVGISVKSNHPRFIEMGSLDAVYGVKGNILSYRIDLRHKLLNIHKELKAPEIFLLQHKVDALIKQWDERTVDRQLKNLVNSGKAEAEAQTIAAIEKLETLSTILRHTLSVDDRVDWDSLKDFSVFSESSKFPEPLPKRTKHIEPYYVSPEISFWDGLLGRASRKREQAKAHFEEAKAKWLSDEAASEAKYRQLRTAWEERRDKFNVEYAQRKEAFERQQADQNKLVDELKAGVSKGELRSVIDHISIVLDRSDYGDLFEKSIDIDYQQESRTLLLEYRLPSPDEMPKVKAVRFISASGELKETFISERDQKANFDSVCYQVCLRTAHEIFEADEHDNIQHILFNGIAQFIDRATGQQVTSTIMSIMFDRETFMKIDLLRVDPKLCFKSLKGVSAASLAALAPIAPVMKFDKEDRRFIDAKAIVGNIEESTNLAAMDWEDFEHLVREVFEKEFDRRGGEVKITQSSSDGGVDAVAFDPDPITGGKIVIQAKRYTRTVGVAAVRDLYGTMQHERASRGILVTTTDYGPDAYQFSAEKPITLMTGANLLHLLERHGIAAKIDVREARHHMNLKESRS